MKKSRILLLGDSISLGYRNIVKHNLSVWAKVLFPQEQGKYASDIYRMLYEWNKGVAYSDVDVVYWNAGLWDVVRIYGDAPQTNIDVYKDYLEKVLLRLRKLYPKSKIIFANTTPVLEERYSSQFYMANDDIKKYNDVAYEALHDKVDVYDNLYEIMDGVGDEYYVDATHFGNAGNNRLSKHICDLLSVVLSEKKQRYIDIVNEFTIKREKILSDIYNQKGKLKVMAWGAGNIFRDYKSIICKYCDIKGIVDKDKRTQGSFFEGYKCVSPTEITDDISLVITTIDNMDAQRDVEEYCVDNDILCCKYQDYLDVMWKKYEQEVLENSSIVLKDYTPNSQDVMQKYIGLIIPENLCNFDCSYCYLSIFNDRRFENICRKNPHLPRFIRHQFRRDVLGGSCLIGFTGSGETLLADGFSDVCTELLKEGHYLHIVTNGTPINKIKEILEKAGEYQEHIIFKLSFHYIELLKRNMLSTFVEGVRMIDASKASYTIEIMPHDELIPHIPDVLEFSKENFGAYPQLTIGRDERDKTKLLTNLSYNEYIDTWKVFESNMFDTRMNLYMLKGKNCNAGPLGYFVDMYSGKVQHCVYYENIGNAYIDGIENIEMNRVGNSCPLNYCYNCHVYATLGILPLENIPTYMQIRDRIKDDGNHWIKEDMRRFLDTKLIM